MGTHGNPWGPMGAHGDPWGPMGAHGAHGTHGDPWGPRGPWGPWGPWDPGDLGSVDGTLVILVISYVSWGFQGLVIFWHDLLLAGALYTPGHTCTARPSRSDRTRWKHPSMVRTVRFGSVRCLIGRFRFRRFGF